MSIPVTNLIVAALVFSLAGCSGAQQPFTDAPAAATQQRMLFGLANIVSRPDEADGLAALAASMGAKITRVPMHWMEIESTRGKSDYEKSDILVAACQSHGIEVQGQLAFPPGWAFTSAAKPTYAPADMDAWKDFVSRTVRLYNGDGVDDAPGLLKPVRYWMIWMGVNKPSHFHGSAADYARVLIASAEAIREANPKAKILVEFSYPSEADDEKGAKGLHFRLDELLDADERVAESFDILAYAWGYADVPPAEAKLLELKEVLERRGSKKPVWFNGFAQFFDTPDGSRPADAKPKDEYLRQAYEMAVRHEIPVFIYGWLKSGSPPGGRWDFGLLNRDGSKQEDDAAGVYERIADPNDAAR